MTAPTDALRARDAQRVHPAAPAESITICHPVWRLDPGGLERQIFHALRHLPTSRFRHVIVVRGLADDEPPGGRFGEHVRFLRHDGAGRGFSRELAVRLRNESINLLHVRGLSMLQDALHAVELCGGAFRRAADCRLATLPPLRRPFRRSH